MTVPLQPGGVERVFSLAFSPSGRTLAVGYGEQGAVSVRLWELASGQMQIRFAGHRGGIMSVAFSPDGTLLASGAGDRTILVWDVTGQRTARLSRKPHLSAAELNALWNDLGDTDTPKAYRVVQTLLAGGEQSVSFLKGRLHPAAPIDLQRIDRLIADLDSEQFAVRQKAEEELRKMGDDAESALRKVLVAKPSTEVRLRVKNLLQSIDTIPPERLRSLRAVEMLEYAATASAREVLKTLAEGASQARLTQEAKAALERLAKRR